MPFIKIFNNIRINYFTLIYSFYLFLLGIPYEIFSQENMLPSEICADTSIKTILLHRTGWDLSMPVIFLNEEETLSLHFDYLGKPLTDYSYSIMNCDHDWKINDISDHQFMEGFNDVPIFDYYPSRNTTRLFTHYEITIPNEEIKILQSGNYLVKVYESADPDKIIFTRRFCIAERKTVITAQIKRPDESHQEILLTIDLNELELVNPLAEIKIAVIKNYNWNDLINISSPPLLRNNILYLDMPYQIYAKGGNEYRYFDSKSTKFISERVEYIDYQAPDFHFYLKTDQLKQFDPYFTSTDLNGRFFVEIPDAHDRHTESDYVYVHFELESEQAFDADVYVYGALTDWKTDENNFMVYNYNKKAYQKSLLLKQGYYNYSYAIRDFNQSDLNFDITEGNHAETENDYLVFVYMTKNMRDFDRLVGYAIFNSTGQSR